MPCNHELLGNLLISLFDRHDIYEKNNCDRRPRVSSDGGDESIFVFDHHDAGSDDGQFVRN